VTRLNLARVTAASLVAAAGLLAVGWLDYAATRRDLLRLLRDQAQSLRQTIAAAARSNRLAGDQAQQQVSERLLDNARLLAELDRRRALDQAVLDEITVRNRLFRVAVFAPDGSRERSSAGDGAGYGFGPGGPGGQGFGGRGFPGGALLQRVLSGGESEVVGQLHNARWGSGARVAAGVRRANGGAILVNADATEIEALQKQVSLDSLVRDIAASTARLAYVSLDVAGQPIAHGDLPVPGRAVTEVATSDAFGERETVTTGGPALEFAGPLEVGGGEAQGVTLRLGLRLDEVRSAERRMLTRLAVSLAAALALSLLALGTIWLRQSYSRLSARHALAEAALRRRDRLSAMGELVSTVAHEVRNPLNAIGMSVQRLRREYPAVAATASDEDRAEMTQLLGVVDAETRRSCGRRWTTSSGMQSRRRPPAGASW
jgi:hypothetical protein